MTVTEPGIEIASVRRVLDAALLSSGSQSVQTVAETIFPTSLYADPGFDWCPGIDKANATKLDAAAEQLYSMYGDILPTLRTCPANSRGTYFGRMVSWPGKEPGGVNQLASRITRLRAVHGHGQRTNNTLDIDLAADALDAQPGGLQVYAATDLRPLGFPCLTHIDLTLFEGRLHCLAVYRHQYLIEKAYGNMLGLSWLLAFLCEQTGFQPGELVVHATMADAQRRQFSDASQLVGKARRALSSEDGE